LCDCAGGCGTEDSQRDGKTSHHFSPVLMSRFFELALES
jgi:hypothetical protein